MIKTLLLLFAASCCGLWAQNTLNGVPGQTMKFAGDIVATDYAKCDGSTNDTTAFTTMSAVATTIRVPAGLTCVILGPTITAHTHIVCGPGGRLLRASGTGTSYMINPAVADFSIDGCIVDGNSVFQNAGSAPYAYIYVSGGDATFTNDAWQNSGTSANSCSGTDCTGAVEMFAASLTVRNSTILNTVLGYQITCTPNAIATNLCRIYGNSLDGSEQVGIWARNFAEGACDGVDIYDNKITNVTDIAADSGATGDAINIYQCQHALVHSNHVSSTRYGCVRVATGSFNSVYDNDCAGAQETAIYCSELGGGNNHCYKNHIKDSASGINATNVSSRSPDSMNVIEGNDCINVAYYCVYVEHDISRNNFADGVPFPFIAGHGSSSHDNVMTGNISMRSTTAYYPVAVTAGVDSSTTGVNQISGNRSSGTTAPSVAEMSAVAFSSNKTVSAITKANPAHVTVTSGTSMANGQTWVLAQISGMVEINGLKCIVASLSGASFDCTGLDSTAFSTFVSTPTGGTAPIGLMQEVWSSGTTFAAAFPSSALITNQTLNFSQLATIQNGSQVYVTDATLGTTCSGSGTGSIAVLNNGNWRCQ